MGESAKAVIRTAVLYAAYVAGSISLAMTLGGPWYAIALALATVGGVALLAIGSARLTSQTGERDVVLPALAAVLGWSAAILLLALSWPQLRSVEFLAGALPRALTLGFIVPLHQAVSPITILVIGGERLGLGIPWALLVIYTAAFWNRRRVHTSDTVKQRRRQA